MNVIKIIPTDLFPLTLWDSLQARISNTIVHMKVGKKIYNPTSAVINHALPPFAMYGATKFDMARKIPAPTITGMEA